jgi:hypothetical protein
MEPNVEPQSMPSPTHEKLPEHSTCLKQEGYVAELTFGRGEKGNHTAHGTRHFKYLILIGHAPLILVYHSIIAFHTLQNFLPYRFPASFAVTATRR